jgi:hypothetical protein
VSGTSWNSFRRRREIIMTDEYSDLAVHRMGRFFLCGTAGLFRGIFMCSQSIGLFFVLCSSLVLGFGTAQAQPQGPDTLWTYTYATPYNDDAQSIAAVADGGFVVGGRTWDPDSGYHALLIRLDSEGHEEWTQTYPYWGRINAIAPFPDGGWALASGDPPFCTMKIIRTDSLGNEQWMRCITQGIYIEEAVSIVRTTDGGLVKLSEGGWLSSPDVDLVRLSPDGDSLWTRSYGGAAEDHGGAVLATEDGGFFVAGSTNHQAWVFITDSLGEMLWHSTFGDPVLTERLWAACKTPSGDYAVAGIWQAESAAYHPFAACVTPYGDTLWTRYFPYLGQGSFHSVAALLDGRILVGGGHVVVNDDVYLAVLLTADGDTVWTAHYDSPVEDVGRALCLTPDSGFAMAGFQSTIAENSENIWVVRTESLYPASAEDLIAPVQFALPSAYPNPFNSTTSIRFVTGIPGRVDLKVYDATGRFVRSILSGLYPSGEHRATFDGRGLPSGNYYYVLSYNAGISSGRMVLLK